MPFLMLTTHTAKFSEHSGITRVENIFERAYLSRINFIIKVSQVQSIVCSRKVSVIQLTNKIYVKLCDTTKKRHQRINYVRTVWLLVGHKYLECTAVLCSKSCLHIAPKCIDKKVHRILTVVASARVWWVRSNPRIFEYAAKMEEEESMLAVKFLKNVAVTKT